MFQKRHLLTKFINQIFSLLISLTVPEEEFRDRDTLLKEKFFARWRRITLSNRPHVIKQVDSDWLRRVMFNPSSRTARQVACDMVESFCNSHQRTREMIDLLTSFLAQLGKAGEAAAEFVALYQVSPSIHKH